MNDTTENTEQVTSLSDYINKVGKLHSYLKNKENIYYRGQNKDFSNTLPSLIRNENYLNNEDKLINDFITKYPELFGACQNNFDRLALMQHHQLPTRLLDLTSNPLVALYFAVERSDVDTNKDSDKNDGKVFPFTDFCGDAPSPDSFGYAPFKSMFSQLSDNTPFHLLLDNLFLKSPFLKSPFSDEIEVESSLTRLDIKYRISVWEKLESFFEFFKNKNDIEEWYEVYTDLINNLKSQPSNSFDKKKLLRSYNDFNTYSSTKRLYHEIRKDIGDFEEKINPFELLIPKIVTPRIIDQRIKNQQSLFMFVPFVYKYGFRENGSQVALNSYEVQNRSETRINILRLLSDSIDPQPMAFVIPHCKKASIRSELESVGITESFIYPDPSHIAHEISKTY